jgi:uncharacterized protein (TIGR00251 family)
MKVNVKVVPNAKENRIVKENNDLKVYVKAPPKHGEANKLLIKLLADHYHVTKNDIKIISGLTSRRKIVEIGNKV